VCEGSTSQESEIIQRSAKRFTNFLYLTELKDCVVEHRRHSMECSPYSPRTRYLYTHFLRVLLVCCHTFIITTIK